MATDLYQLKNGKLSYYLHRGQERAWDSTARFTWIIAGTQSGKTSFLPLWLSREINTRGQGDYLAATATYDLFKLKFLPEMRQFFCSMLGWQEDKSDRVFWRRDAPASPMTRIILRSASSEGGLESATVKGAVLDECGQDEFRITAWEAVQRRLAIHRGRALGGTTPYNLGWLKTEVFDRWEAGDTDHRIIQFRSIDNPIFPREEYDRAKRTMAAWKFEMFYNGEFSRPAGLIYGDYSTAQNEVEDFEIPDTWPRFVGVDFGGVHMATIWGAHDPQTELLYLYRETLEGGLTIAEHAKKWNAVTDRKLVVQWTGGAPSEDQWRRDFDSHGIPLRKPGVGDVETGIDRVIAYIKPRKLRVFKSLKMIRDELGIYSRPVDENGQPTEGIKNKNDFHLLDALRYLIIGIAEAGPTPDQLARLGKVENFASRWK